MSYKIDRTMQFLFKRIRKLQKDNQNKVDNQNKIEEKLNKITLLKYNIHSINKNLK